MAVSKEVMNFTTEILNDLLADITDKVFLKIQSDKELMKKYLSFVIHKDNNLTSGGQVVDLRGLNSQIAQAVCESLNLSAGDEKNASSSLIYTYTELKIK